MTKGLAPDWKPLHTLETDNSSAQLLGALLTTYDPPDADVLIEDFLPSWLNLRSAYTNEREDRLRYFAELENQLRILKGKIAIIASPKDFAPTANSWLWHFIRRFEVGANGPADQHAKLWMFHRAPAEQNGYETLEIVISSGNLSRDGLRGQIQAGWRGVFDLEKSSSKARSKTWGLLIPFLEQLGESCGKSCQQTIEYWLELLGRCECPQGVRFIASVPGRHSRQTLNKPLSSWGVVGLKNCWSGSTKPRLSVMVPTIGRWDSKSFKSWAESAGVEINRLSVAWIEGNHPWAAKWQIPTDSEQAITQSGAKWLKIPKPNDDWKSPFSDEHRETDTRWSHAKLYQLQQGSKKQLLITSANLSCAAWGARTTDGRLYIKNFELGVLVPIKDGFADDLRALKFGRSTSENSETETGEHPIAWLAAEWDGKSISIACRLGDGYELDHNIEIFPTNSKTNKTTKINWTRGKLCSGKLPWLVENGVPLFIAIKTRQGEKRQAVVNDIRKGIVSEIVIDDFDRSELNEQLLRLLEERYGYSQEWLTDTANVARTEKVTQTNNADYSVSAYVEARRRFQLIDNWLRELNESDKRFRPFILRDGQFILDGWQKAVTSNDVSPKSLSAKLAIEELQYWLKEKK